MGSGERTKFDNPTIEWIDSRLPIFTMLQKEYGVFPTPRNFNYFWNFGAIAGVMLVTMIVTGIVLAMHYTGDTQQSFDAVERIMRDVNGGWLIRYIHSNGASFFFLAVYIHIFRGMYYGSYKAPREILWIFGVTIFLLMMATAFIGYVLPWGQMSLWGATVITNLFSAIPLVGDSIVTLLWGGFAVDNPTLTRFFALHYLLPFVIFAVAFLHVWALYMTGSINPLGIDTKGPQDTLPFHPYYTMKDSVGILAFLLVYATFIFFLPNALGHPDNYIPADPLVTPPHIVPEWYFLPFYAILRAITFETNLVMLGGFGLMFMPFFWNFGAGVAKMIVGLKLPKFETMTPRPILLALGLVVLGLGAVLHGKVPLLTDVTILDAKLGGVIAMFGSILIWFVLPWLDSHPIRSARFRPVMRPLFLVLVAIFLFLGYAGAKSADATLLGIPFSVFALMATGYYFAYFLIILPILAKTEKGLELPSSIHEAVLAKEKAKQAKNNPSPEAAE